MTAEADSGGEIVQPGGLTNARRVTRIHVTERRPRRPASPATRALFERLERVDVKRELAEVVTCRSLDEPTSAMPTRRMRSHLDLNPWQAWSMAAIERLEGMPIVTQKGSPWPLRCDDVGTMRAELEAKGVEFRGDTFDTGVCHMAIFASPDGNELMLHRRYASYE